MNLSTATKELQQEKIDHESLETYVKAFEGKFPHKRDTNLLKKYEQVLMDVVPGYKPLTADEKKARKELHELAVKKLPAAMYSQNHGTKNVPDGLNRAFYSLFKGMSDTEADNAKKAEMVDIIMNGSAEQRHDLFLDAMNKMANFDLDGYRAMSSKEKIENLSAVLPTLYMGMEGQSLLAAFDNLNCGVTNEEKEQFFELYDTLKVEQSLLLAQLDCIYSPYYADMDLTMISNDTETQNRIEEECEERGFVITDTPLEDYKIMNGTVVADYSLQIRGEVVRDFRKGRNPNEKLTSENVWFMLDSGEKSNRSTDSQLDFARLRSGEKVMYTLDKEDAPLACFCDLNGDGYPTQIPAGLELPKKPAKVDKPNGFVMLIDKIVRAINGKGLESVNKYNSYVNRKTVYDNKMAELKHQYCTRNFTTAFNGTANAVKQKTNERRLNKSAQVSKEAGQPAKNHVKETTAERARRVTMEFMSDADRMSLMDKKWAHDNPDAIRDAYVFFKEDFLKGKSEPYSEEVQNTVNEFDKNIASCERSVQERISGKSGLEKNNEISTSKQEQLSEPVKNKDGAMNLLQ